MIVECKDCNNVKYALRKLDCTLIYYAKERYKALIFNLSTTIADEDLRDILRFKRILEKRVYNCSYPDTSFVTSDILLKINGIIKIDNCSVCETCFPELPNV